MIKEKKNAGKISKFKTSKTKVFEAKASDVRISKAKMSKVKESKSKVSDTKSEIKVSEVKIHRAKRKFDAEQVEIYGKFRATYETMAGHMGVSVDVIRKKMEDEESDFSKAYKKGFSDCKLKLTEQQLYWAFKGNATLLVWLGKQYLGEAEQIGSNESIETRDTTEQQLTEVFKQMFFASSKGDKA